MLPPARARCSLGDAPQHVANSASIWQAPSAAGRAVLCCGMAEVPPQDVAADGSTISESPLRDILAESDLAEWASWGKIPVISTFGHPQAEYAAVRRGVGLLDLPQRGVIEATGRDRLVFLNNLLTNGLVGPQTKTPLPAGHGCYSFFLNLKGRVVADMNALEVPGQDRTLIECDAAAVGVLLKTFDLYLFAEKVTLRDATAEFYALALHGPNALELLADAADGAVAFEATPADFPATADLPTTTLSIGGVPCVAFRDDPCGVPGVTLLAGRDSAVRVWSDMTTRFGGTGDDRDFGRRRLTPIGWAMFNACRIEAGRPLMNVDFAAAPPSRPGKRKTADDEPAEEKGGVLPAETGPLFARAVSTTTGCYLGQEVVARMHARQVVAKKLVGVRMDEDALPSAGAPVEVDDKQVGYVTGSTLSPVLSAACLALAMVKRPHFEVGAKLTIPAEGRHATGTVVALPFLTS